MLLAILRLAYAISPNFVILYFSDRPYTSCEQKRILHRTLLYSNFPLTQRWRLKKRQISARLVWKSPATGTFATLKYKHYQRRLWHFQLNVVHLSWDRTPWDTRGVYRGRCVSQLQKAQNQTNPIHSLYAIIDFFYILTFNWPFIHFIEKVIRHF